MAATETEIIGDKKYTARELTVKEIKTMLDTIQDSSVLNNLIDSDIPAEGVALACDVSIDDLEEHLPSELQKIWVAVEKINPSLAGMVRNTVAVMEQLKDLSSSLSGVSAGSSD